MVLGLAKFTLESRKTRPWARWASLGLPEAKLTIFPLDTDPRNQ